MLEALLTLLLVLGIFGLGVGLVIVVRRDREKSRPGITPQSLGALAQPYRTLLGEAVAVQKEVEKQAAAAPDALRNELERLANEIGFLVARAYPRARQGTELSSYLLKLEAGSDEYTRTLHTAEALESELHRFVTTLKTLRDKVYRVLTEASKLGADPRLERDLQDALFEVSALEEAFAELEPSP